MRTDIAIIGAGPGGYVAALRGTQLGAEVALIEKKAVGGVCLNEGCIPTKALLRTAELCELSREAGAYGVRVDEPQLDWRAAQERMRSVTRQIVANVEKLLDRAGVHVLRGEAMFARSGTLRVQMANGRETVEADRIIIATGSRTAQVPIPGLDGPNVIDHWGAMELPELPNSICIIGAGAIGVEFASLLNAFGVRVTLVEMLERVAPLMDRSIGEGLEWSLSQRGVDVLTGTRVTSITHGDSGCEVLMTTPDGERRMDTQLVLSAIGRTPNTEGLGLEVIGLQPTRAGIGVDSHMRTAAPHVYAIGDVAAEGPMLAHVASHQGIVAVEDALGHTAFMDYRAVPSCIFSLPEAAGVGLTEAQAREQGYEVRTGLFALPNTGKGLASGQTEGFVKIVADAENDAVLGVHIMGPHASELILEGTMAISLEATLDEVERTIHPHPTLGEAIAEAAMAARCRAIHLPAR